MSTITLALGSVSSDETCIRLETKEAMSDYRKTLSPNSISLLQILLNVKELSAVFDPLELAQWIPLLTLPISIEFHIHGVGSFTEIHTSLLLADLQATSERRQGPLRILTASRQSAPSKDTLSSNQLQQHLTTEPMLIVDEDELLADTTLGVPTLKPRSANADKDDCSGRMPCDNCTCGRAESAQSQSNMDKVTKSECGNCGKGDAFRCASCPYLGKPAFKAGEEHLVLDLVDDF
jgi:anamorsin